jgi:hypothetical protein
MASFRADSLGLLVLALAAFDCCNFVLLAEIAFFLFGCGVAGVAGVADVADVAAGFAVCLSEVSRFLVALVGVADLVALLCFWAFGWGCCRQS